MYEIDLSDLRPLVLTDAGRSTSDYPKEKNDCVVRATTIAFDIPYNKAHEIMEVGGRVAGNGTSPDLYKKEWDTLSKEKGVKIIKHSFPAKKGKKRMNVLEFCKSHLTGTFITIQAGHIATVKDGKVYDTAPFGWWCWERCVYTAFEILPS